MRPFNTTELVHEAFLRMAHGQHPSYENRSHFYEIASRLMRQILVDLARARSSEKPGGIEEVRLAEIPEVGRPRTNRCWSWTMRSSGWPEWIP